MNAGELKKLLEGVPDDMPVKGYIERSDGCDDDSFKDLNPALCGVQRAWLDRGYWLSKAYEKQFDEELKEFPRDPEDLPVPIFLIV